MYFFFFSFFLFFKGPSNIIHKQILNLYMLLFFIFLNGGRH